jgi:DNA invertase Pin-like site-specific DNA recombinase
MAKRALVLVRVSSDLQKDNYSPESQESGCREYARENGLEVTQVITEVCSGALEFDQRPIFGEVLDAIRGRTTNALIVHRINRATRAGGIHALLLAHECQQNKVELHFVDGSVKGLVDITTTAGRIMLLISGDQAYEERASLLEAMHRGRKTRVVSHGRPLHGRRQRYGWTWVDERDPRTGKLILKARAEICEPEATIVRRMYDEAAHGAPLYQIVNGLIRDGVPNTVGEAKWNNAFVRSILRDQRYMGVAYAMRYKKIKTGSGYMVVMRPEEEQVRLPDGTFPAIVSEDLWYAVQDILSKNRLQATRNNHHPERALLRAGFAYCAECGASMVVDNRPGDYADYLCKKTPWNRNVCGHPRMRAPTLDDRVWRLLRRILAHPEVVTRELHRRYATGDEALRKDLENSQKTLAGLKADESAGIALAIRAADEVQRAQVEAHLALLARQRQAAQLAVNQAERRLENQQHMVANLGVTSAQLQRLSTRLDSATWQDKRKAVQVLVKEVRIWPARHHTPHRWEITIQIPKFLPFEVEEGIVLGFDETTRNG